MKKKQRFSEFKILSWSLRAKRGNLLLFLKISSVSFDKFHIPHNDEIKNKKKRRYDVSPLNVLLKFSENQKNLSV